MIPLDRPGQGVDGLALFPLRAMGCTVNLSWPAFCLESRPMNVLVRFRRFGDVRGFERGCDLVGRWQTLLVLVSGAVFAFMFIKYGCLAH